MKRFLGTFLASFSKGVCLLALSLCQVPAAAPPPIELTHNAKLQVTQIAPAWEGHFPEISSLAWNPDGSQLLFSATSLNGFSQIYTVTLKGGKITPLTARRFSHTSRCHNHGAIWETSSPSSICLLFSGQTPPHGSLTYSVPDLGIGCNLFLHSLENNDFQQLTFLPASHGALHPLLSPNQHQLLWTETDGKTRSLVLGELQLQDSVAILHPRRLNPYPKASFVEGHQFTPDGSALLISVTPSPNAPWYGMDICRLDLKTQTPLLLTRTPDVWDNFPAISPKGKKILWSSSQNLNSSFLGDNGALWKTSLVSELWIMNQDGRHPTQLTTFNTPGSSHFTGEKSWIGPIAWHPAAADKIAFILNQHISPFHNQSLIYIATLSPK